MGCPLLLPCLSYFISKSEGYALSLLPVPGFNCPSLVWLLGLGQCPVLCDGPLQDEHPDSGGGLVHHGIKVSSTSLQSLRSLVCRWRIINWPSAVGIRVDVLGHTPRATLSSGFCEQRPPLGQQESSVRRRRWFSLGLVLLWLQNA